ncbi:ABC transporter ATP-binding protein [Catenulispora subtropica]|uniref:ABC transporter ATP-binding protein n=1 Tax=Catenulispora subtropica TaxID=450798 RepID=A0ABN2TD47_9ACTN
MPSSSTRARRDRLRLLRLLREAPVPAVAGSVLLQVALGAAPVAFMLFSSAAVGKVRAAAGGGTSSAAWHQLELLMVLAAATLVVGQVLAPVQRLAGWTLQYRMDLDIYRRLMAANYSAPGIAVMERPQVRAALDETIADMRRTQATPGGAAAAMLTLIARYTAFLGALIVVAVALSPVAALAAGTGGMVLRVTHRRGATAYSTAIVDTIQLRRRNWFLSTQGLSPAIGKEARVFGFGPWLADQATEEGLGYFRMLWKVRSRIFIAPFALAATVTALGAAVALAQAAWPRFGGGLSAGTTTLVAQAVIAAVGIGAAFEESDYVISYGLTCLRHLEQVEAAVGQARAATVDEPGGAASPVGPVRESIRFEDVGFTYPGAGEAVLTGFSLELEAGTSLAVVGVNGAGKTTLIKLLCRFYEPDSGRIVIDGVDAAALDASRWQRQIAATFQDYGKYPLSAADNIGFGAAELVADRDAVERAAARAGAADYLRELSQGFDTTLSRDFKGGTDLSGGQWQRVALARAMLAVDGGASVLILDEPTASLDIRAEADFIDGFLELTRGTTTIVVSHRFATVRRADRIVVLDGGRIVEDGTHDELMTLGGRYAEMFTVQAARFAVPAHGSGGDDGEDR